MTLREWLTEIRLWADEDLAKGFVVEGIQVTPARPIHDVEVLAARAWKLPWALPVGTRLHLAGDPLVVHAYEERHLSLRYADGPGGLRIPYREVPAELLDYELTWPSGDV